MRWSKGWVLACVLCLATGATAGELVGQVVRVQNGTLYLEHEGAVVPFRLDARTAFSDPELPRAALTRGTTVRATFTVSDLTNVATALSTARDAPVGSGAAPPRHDLPGTGGAGPFPVEVDERPTDIERTPGPPVPEEPGTENPREPPRVR